MPFSTTNDRRHLARGARARPGTVSGAPWLGAETGPAEHPRTQAVGRRQRDLDDKGARVGVHGATRIPLPCRRRSRRRDRYPSRARLARWRRVRLSDPRFVHADLESEAARLQPHQRRAGRRHVARLHHLLGDDAVERRRDVGERLGGAGRIASGSRARHARHAVLAHVPRRRGPRLRRAEGGGGFIEFLCRRRSFGVEACDRDRRSLASATAASRATASAAVAATF